MTKKSHSISRSMAMVSIGNALSRVMGLLREVLMAVTFGTSVYQSAFTVAFTVPNLFRRLFGEGALSAALIPVFTESLEKDGKEKAVLFARRILTMTAVILTLVTMAVTVIITVCLILCKMNLEAGLTFSLLRIMMPYMPFICVAALCMAVLNSLRVFAIPAMTSVLLNIVWILVLLVICPLTSDMFRKVHYLAWGILIAGIIQFLFQLPCMIRQKVKPVPDFRWRSDPRIKKVFLLMGPAAVGMGVFQINTLIDKFLAFWVSTWAPAALSFCERLVYLPLGVFATAMGTVLLPTFSRQTARDDAGAILKTLNTSLRSLMLITVPSAIGLFALAGPIVQLVFEWKGGMFDALSTERTMRALMFLSPGLIVFSLHKIFVPVFYAHQDTKTPVKIGIMAVVLNLVLNITFILTWPFEYKHAGIALATVLSSTVNAVILGCIISARIGSPGWRSIGLSFLMFVISGLVMAFAVRAGYGYLLEFLVAKGFSGKVCQLLAVIMAICEGVVVYCVLVFILARRDITNLIKKFIHRV